MCEYDINIEFVDKKLIEKKCEICNKFIKNPIMTSCGHRCGEECLNNKQNLIKICPFCNNQNCITSQDLRLNNKINNSLVICKYPFCSHQVKYCPVI